MPFPFEFPFEFDAWLSEMVVLTSPLNRSSVLASPLNQGPEVLVSTIRQRVLMNSALTISVELSGRS